MSDGEAVSRSTKHDRRKVARDKAKGLRDAQRKKDRRGRWLIQGGIIVGSLAVIAVIVFAVVTAIRPPSSGPANMASDGIVVGTDLAAVVTEPVEADSKPVATEISASVPNIRIYLDYLCPHCGDFEKFNGKQLGEWATAGTATVEYHPIATLTGKSAGTQYSLRAANAAACVANYSPNRFFDFNSLLLADQPEQGTPGLDDAAIQKIAAEAKVEKKSTIDDCIDDQEFKSWVQDATERALAEPVPNSRVERVQGTPTVLVNDKQYTGSLTDPKEFQAFVLSVVSDSYTDSTGTPTPTPSPSVAP